MLISVNNEPTKFVFQNDSENNLTENEKFVLQKINLRVFEKNDIDEIEIKSLKTIMKKTKNT